MSREIPDVFLIQKIEEIIKWSDFLPRFILEYAKHLNDRVKLEKLLVILHQAKLQEQSMSDGEKEEFTQKMIEITNFKIATYQKTLKNIRVQAEQIESQWENFDTLFDNF